ncbi:helix-turn-helix domain-containing protein [Atopobacter phocae]|uniref:helix-turn-helix domain-containing protein n=1 Tax=Atopobacter phocae TaxID=136492 RepID=UPI000470B642|nr:helix-turn-helix domain-containing protein [Atopobacter phocae]
MTKSIRTLFPNAYLTRELVHQQVIQIPMNGQQLTIPLEDLTEREQWLVQQLTHHADVQPFVPLSSFPPAWDAFILNQETTIPNSTSKFYIQWLYIQPHHIIIPDSHWLDIFQTVIPHVFGVMWLDPQTILIGTLTSEPFDLFHLMQEIEEPLSEELGELFNVFVGHRWPIQQFSYLIFQAEKEIFKQLVEMNQAFLTHLPAIHAWYAKKEWHNQVPLIEAIRQLIQLTNDEQELINAMWDASLNISKASKMLFIHRNTLNYRLDRFYSQTGYQLRHIDELTFVKSLFPQFRPQHLLD